MPDYTVASATSVLSQFRGHVERDLGPIVARVVAAGPGPGFFTILREVFAHIEFLGALYCGYDGGTGGGPRRIATTKKSVAFVAEVLGEVDAAYRDHARLLYEMYRHGTVHVSRPHQLRRPDGATIEFVLYDGRRNDVPICYDGRPWTVSHLHPQPIDQGRFILPLSIDVLYDDLLAGIDRYCAALRSAGSRGGATLLQNFSNTMNALMEPDATNETWQDIPRDLSRPP